VPSHRQNPRAEHAELTRPVGAAIGRTCARAIVRADSGDSRQGLHQVEVGARPRRVVPCLGHDRRRACPSTHPIELVAADVNPSGTQLPRVQLRRRVARVPARRNAEEGEQRQPETILWKVILRSKPRKLQDVVVWHLGLDSSRPRDFPRVTPKRPCRRRSSSYSGARAGSSSDWCQPGSEAVTRTIR
jgi:hypothetical protein